MRRREIEKGLREGAVRAVVSTNALELGIDIGALDVSVMAGYPGTIAATWQRAGRAGRRSGRSAAVMVASSAPLDQFVVRNPSYFFDASPEHALIDPDNLHILVDHIKCAAFELPFTAAEAFGRHDVQEILGAARGAGARAICRGDAGDERCTWPWTNESYPADAVSLRSVSSDNFVVVDTTHETPRHRRNRFHQRPGDAAPEGDLHRRRQAVPGGAARLRGPQGVRARRSTATTTPTRSPTRSVTSLDTFATTAATIADVRTAKSTSSSRVVGFKKIKFYTNENVGSGELDLPEQQMHTTAYWLTIPETRDGALPYAADDRRDGVVGLSFAMRQVAQLLLMCDRPRHRHLDRQRRRRREPDAPERHVQSRASSSTTTIRAASASARRSSACTTSCSRRRAQLIAECECESGCPGCVGPVGNTGPLAKVAALRILDSAAGSRSRGEIGMSSLSDRLRGDHPRPTRRHPGSRTEPRRAPRAPRRISKHCSTAEWSRPLFVVERRMPASAKSRPRRVGGRSAERLQRSRRTKRRSCAAARPRVRRSCSSISRRPD